MSDTAPRPDHVASAPTEPTPPSGYSTRVTDAMERRGLRSEATEHAHLVHVLGYGAMPEEIEYRLAAHRAKIAWAEVEYAARRGGNCVDTTYAPPPQAMMTALLAKAYAADEAHLQARRAKADAIYHERYRMARR